MRPVARRPATAAARLAAGQARQLPTVATAETPVHLRVVTAAPAALAATLALTTAVLAVGIPVPSVAPRMRRPPLPVIPVTAATPAATVATAAPVPEALVQRPVVRVATRPVV